MKNLWLALIIVLAHLTTYAQYNPDKVNKKAAALYEQGINKATDGDLKEGIRLLKEAVRIDDQHGAAIGHDGRHDLPGFRIAVFAGDGQQMPFGRAEHMELAVTRSGWWQRTRRAGVRIERQVLWHGSMSRRVR